MAVAFNVPSVDEDDYGQGKPSGQLGQNQPQPHAASTNVSQQVRSSAEHGQQRLVAAFHQILAAYARHAILAQDQPSATSVPTPACLQCEKLYYLLRLLH